MGSGDLVGNSNTQSNIDTEKLENRVERWFFDW
jgi:hypothetical protein